MKRRLVSSNWDSARSPSTVTPLDPMTQIAGELVEVSVFAADKVDMGGCIWDTGRNTYLDTRESALPMLCPVSQKVIWSLSRRVKLKLPPESLFLQPKPISHFDTEIWRKRMLTNETESVVQQTFKSWRSFYSIVIWVMAYCDAH